MKKILLMVLVVGLVGCEESETGLQKNVINTAYSECRARLKETLKSPSSLRVQASTVDTYIPDLFDIYRIFGETIITNGSVSSLKQDDETRFRGVGVRLEYDAQNSFGVYLPGGFECSYLYELRSNNTSPTQLKLIQVSTGKEKVVLNSTISNFNKLSNTLLDGGIGGVYGAPSEFTKSDADLYGKLVKLHKDIVAAKNTLNESATNSTPIDNDPPIDAAPH